MRNGDERLSALEAQTPFDSSAPLPFEDLLLPFVLTARRRLLERFPATHALSPVAGVADSAYLSLERALLVQLVNISGLALLQQFDESCDTGRRAALKLCGSLPDEAPREGYRAFVRRHLDLRWAEPFARYPVLERLLDRAVDNWCSATEEFLTRLAQDWPEIRTDSVVRLFPWQSDPHNGNRTVVVVEHASGRKRVYKPKALELEAAFNRLLAWCNARGAEPRFKPLTVHCRDDYGWTEHVEQQPCGERADAQRYYRRAGGLLAVLQVLQATDCHRENLIASGEHPILVDAETLFHTFPRPPRQAVAFQRATVELREFLGTVIGTGMLPRWDIQLDARVVFDNSALGCVQEHPGPVASPRITNVNTDDMMVRYETAPVSPAKNVPMLSGAPALPEHFVAELCQGFTAGYRLLSRERVALLAPSGPLHGFKGLRARYLLRNTRLYQQLLASSYDPTLLRSDAARNARFAALQSNGIAQSSAREVVQWELDALENLDVPHFTRFTDDTALRCGDNRSAPNFFEQSGYERVVGVLEGVSEADLRYQLAIIRGSLHARSSGASPSAEALEARPTPDPAPLTSAALLAEAIRLGDELLERAHRRPNASLRWLGLGYLASVERFQVQPLGENLYEGKAGVALFLAALSAVTGQTRFAETALEALATARGLWREGPEILAAMVRPESLGIGGVVGLGSIAYALSAAATLLGDEELQTDAIETALSLGQAAIVADREYDVMSGAAGALLAVLAVHTRSAEPRLLSVAKLCGEHLLEARSGNDESQPLGWSRSDRPALTGFSHGAGGIGLALSRLAQATGNARYEEGALTALAFERHWYSSQARNWADLRRSDESPTFMTSWCHGAPGIGLSRAAWETAKKDRPLLAEIAAAVETSAAHGLNDVDHLCCGNFGRFELLTATEAGADIREQAARALSRVVTDADRHGGYRLFHGLPRAAWTPGFFRGTAGIGYSLLRRVAPSRLPNILTLD